MDNMLMGGEEVLWRGKPKKNAFVMNRIIKILPIALIWILFDGIMIGAMIITGAIREMLWFAIPFFAFHLLPVWVWLGNVISASKRWKNTEYAITDKRIILRDGLFGYNFKSIDYAEVDHVNIRVGFIDRLLKVGDIHITVSGKTDNNVILDIEQPFSVFKMLQKTVLDIKTDIHYPNELRPKVNPGYNTQYRNF
jgi:membrane protein YdbS with pleckstrin-like domain